jgi:UPF0755 protein
VKTFVLGLISLFFLGSLAVSAGVAYWFLEWPPVAEGAPGSEIKIFDLAPGMSARAVAKKLQEENLIKHENLFLLYARMLGQLGNLRVGEYELRSSMLPSEVLRVITSGRSRARYFTIPEGWNIFEMAEFFERNQIASAHQFLEAAKDPDRVKKWTGLSDLYSVEGYLFPSTYEYTKYSTLDSIIEKMLQTMRVELNKLETRILQKGWSVHQILTMASIVEKETGAPWERDLIAGVFMNRFRKKMPMQTDPTVLYAKMLTSGKFERNITREDLRRDHPYNTYTRTGLPPGPIASPGVDAIKAALNPSKTEYLFFVSRNDGTHVFSKTYAEHQKAVRRFQLDPAARQGRSWRDLNQRSALTPSR